MCVGRSGDGTFFTPKLSAHIKFQSELTQDYVILCNYPIWTSQSQLKYSTSLYYNGQGGDKKEQERESIGILHLRVLRQLKEVFNRRCWSL